MTETAGATAPKPPTQGVGGPTVGTASTGSTVSVVEKREKVVEWRLTRSVATFKARLWVESDEAHGGVSREQAVETFAQVARDLKHEDASVRRSQKKLAEYLYDRLPFASSVEVCDDNGDGVAIHRDWP